MIHRTSRKNSASVILVFLALSANNSFAQDIVFDPGRILTTPGTTVEISPIPPSDNFSGNWPRLYPAVLNIGDTTQAEWLVEFDIPSFLVNENKQDSLECFYSDSSAVGYSACNLENYPYAEDCPYWNPTTPHSIFNDGINFGALIVGLGTRVTVPLSARIGERYVGTISCIARRLIDNLTLTAQSEFQLRIISGRQWPEFSDGTLVGLNVGETYSILPPSGSVQPLINGREQGTLIVFPLDGEPLTTMCVQFALAERMPGWNFPGAIACSFPPGSARWMERDTLFDPRERMAITLDADGLATIELGFTVTVPETARADVFGTDIIMTTYTVYGTDNPCLGDGGIVRSGAVLVLVDVIGERRPKSFTLHQSYPNPVNGTATIRYDLPEPADVEITVYSVLGERVVTLVDGFRYAGEHSASISTDALPSGVYFYRLRAGSVTQTKRMVVMK